MEFSLQSIKEFNAKNYPSVAARICRDTLTLLQQSEAQNADLRLHYAGVIGLLCDACVYLPHESEHRKAIWDAVNDWCDKTGWGCKQILNRIEVYPPAYKNQ
jgi:hypothetical protein